MSKERRKAYTFTLLPSVIESARAAAASRNRSLSRFVEDLLSTFHLERPTREAINDVLEYLNRRTGRRFTARTPSGKPTSNADLIRARLGEGYTAQDLKAVIDLKVAEWSISLEMVRYLRPATLFARSNFQAYIGDVDAPGLGATEQVRRYFGDEAARYIEEVEGA